MCTLPETNIATENGWLEGYFPFGMAYFQGFAIIGRSNSFSWIVQGNPGAWAMRCRIGA